MDEVQYKELRNAYGDDYFSFLYAYGKAQGLKVSAQQFGGMFLQWLGGSVEKIAEITRELDIKHGVTLVVDLETGKAIKII